MGFHFFAGEVTIDQPIASKIVDVVVQRMHKFTERRTFHTPKRPIFHPCCGTARLKARQNIFHKLVQATKPQATHQVGVILTIVSARNRSGDPKLDSYVRWGKNLNFFLGRLFPKPEKKLPKKIFFVCELIWVTG